MGWHKRVKAEKKEWTQGEAQGPRTLTVLYVLPQDPVFGIIFKSHKAALLRTADLRQERGSMKEQQGGAGLPPNPVLCASEDR